MKSDIIKETVAFVKTHGQGGERPSGSGPTTITRTQPRQASKAGRQAPSLRQVTTPSVYPSAESPRPQSVNDPLSKSDSELDYVVSKVERSSRVEWKAVVARWR